MRAMLVGYGGIAREMLKELTKKSWYQTAAIVDTRDEALAEAKSALSLGQENLFKDLDTALEQSDADVVMINTPSELHFDQTKVVLKSGRHALVAKPITNNFEQAVELVEIAAANRVTMSVGQQIRYNRHYRAVQRFVESGALGEVEVINFLNTKPRHKALNLANMDQPALYEMACHHFDSLMAIAPAQPEWIMCDGFRPSWSVYSGPCMVNGLIRLGGGVHVVYHSGFSSQADCYELRLEGSKGALRCRGIHMSNDTMAYEFAERGGKFSIIDIDSDILAANPFGLFFDLWYDHYQAGSDVPFSGHNNLKVFALLSAGIDSVNSGRPIDVASNSRYSAAFA